MIHPVHETEERLVCVVEWRGFDVGEHRGDQRLVSEEFRRNCGVRLRRLTSPVKKPA